MIFQKNIGNEFKIKITLAIISGGHILIEDLPGKAKSFAKSLTESLNLILKEFNLHQICYQVIF